jgi:hypothetical protein
MYFFTILRWHFYRLRVCKICHNENKLKKLGLIGPFKVYSAILLGAQKKLGRARGQAMAAIYFTNE